MGRTAQKVDVRLSPEQQALQDSAAQVVGRLGPTTVRDLDDAERAAKLDAAVESSGWRELRQAGEEGAPLASGVEAAIIAEELGRGLADTSFIGPTLAADLRRRACGAPSSPAEPETVALTTDLAALAGPAEPKVAIDARNVAFALVGSETVRRLPLGPSAVGEDLTRRVAGTGSDGVAIGDVAKEEVQSWTALGLALACADLVGVMRGAIDLATGYATDRRQFGTAVGSFQAVQHMLADAYVAMEGSHSVTRHAAWAVDALPAAHALGAASVAKAYCSRAARTVCETAIQVHGGIGNTWECMAHVYLRRALFSIDFLGGIGTSLTRVLAHNGIAS
jgi:alkylation response protein AidB-like acyl-CoA dehydrogenase